MSMTDVVVRKSFTVNCPTDKAFQVFTEGFDTGACPGRVRAPQPRPLWRSPGEDARRVRSRRRLDRAARRVRSGRRFIAQP